MHPSSCRTVACHSLLHACKPSYTQPQHNACCECPACLQSQVPCTSATQPRAMPDMAQRAKHACATLTCVWLEWTNCGVLGVCIVCGSGPVLESPIVREEASAALCSATVVPRASSVAGAIACAAATQRAAQEEDSNLPMQRPCLLAGCTKQILAVQTVGYLCLSGHILSALWPQTHGTHSHAHFSAPAYEMRSHSVRS
jgi:hypothetical protein